MRDTPNRKGSMLFSMILSIGLAGCGGGGDDDDAVGGTTVGGIDGVATGAFSGPGGLHQPDITGRFFSGNDICGPTGSTMGYFITRGDGKGTLALINSGGTAPAGFNQPYAGLVEGVVLTEAGKNVQGFERATYTADYRTKVQGVADTIPLTGYIALDVPNDILYASCESSSSINGFKPLYAFAAPAEQWGPFIEDASDAHHARLDSFSATLVTLEADYAAANIDDTDFIYGISTAINSYANGIESPLRAAATDNDPGAPYQGIVHYDDVVLNVFYWLGQGDSDELQKSQTIETAYPLASLAARNAYDNAVDALDAMYVQLVADHTPPPIM